MLADWNLLKHVQTRENTAHRATKVFFFTILTLIRGVNVNIWYEYLYSLTQSELLVKFPSVVLKNISPGFLKDIQSFSLESVKMISYWFNHFEALGRPVND